MDKLYNGENDVVIAGTPRLMERNGVKQYVFEVDGKFYACRKEHYDAFGGNGNIIRAGANERTPWTVHTSDGNLAAVMMPLTTEGITKAEFEKMPVLERQAAEIRYSFDDGSRLDNESSKEQARSEEAEKIFKAPQSAIEKLSGQIDKWLRGELPSNELFSFGDTPVILQLLGAKGLPVVMSQNTMSKVTGVKHPVSLENVRNLIAGIHDPLMVFKSATVDNAFVVLTELEDMVGRPIIAAIHLNKTDNRLKINRIASIYGRNHANHFIEEQFKSGNVKYVEKTKSQEWSTSRGLQLPKLVQSNPDNNSILQKEDIVNIYFAQKSKKDANSKEVKNGDVAKSSLEGSTNNEGRSLLSDGSGQRADGSRAGEQTGIVAESTGGYQEGRKTAGERRKRAEALRADGLTHKEKISSGESEIQAEVIDEAGYNDEMRALVEGNKKRGISKTIIITGNAEISKGKGAGRKTKSARGVFIRRANGETIVVVRYDHALYTPQQLNRHELVHMDYQTEAVQKAKKVILNSLSISQRRAAVRKLRRDYAGMLEGMEEGAVEELVCNILAGMSEYSQSFSDMTVAYWNGNETALDSFRVSEYTESIDAGGQNAEVLGSTGYGEGGSLRYSFAGNKAMTADLSLLEIAKIRLESGESKERIFKETGWFKSTDGMWRFEIDDSKAKFFFEKLKDEALLPEILEHKDLYEAYPFLENTKVKVADLPAKKRANYDARRNIITLSRTVFVATGETDIAKNKESVLHEVQHAIQEYEGFSSGGSVDDLLEYMRSRAQQHLTSVGDPEFNRIVEHGTISELLEYTDNYIKAEFKTESAESAARIVYYNLHGEKEAREAAHRLGKSAPERKAVYPDFGKGAMIPDGYEGRNIDDRISETKEDLPGGGFVEALLSDTGRRVQGAAGRAEKLPHTRFPETKEGYTLSSYADDAGDIIPLKKHHSKDTDLRFSLDDDGEFDLIDIWNQRVEEYGEMPQGEKPARDTKVPKKIAKDKPVRHEENNKSQRISVNMPEGERYEVLKNEKITPQKVDNVDAADIDFDYLENNIKSVVEKGLLKKFQQLGLFKTYRSIAVGDVAFDFTGKGFRKSIHSQENVYGGNKADFAKVLLNLQSLLDASVLIEMHTDKGKGTNKEKRGLDKVYVLFSALDDGGQIIPVQFEIEQYIGRDNRLYLAVALTKIETGVKGNMASDKQKATSLVPVSDISISEIFAKINPSDKNFLKYIPDQFLNKEQLTAKEDALEADRKKYFGDSGVGKEDDIGTDLFQEGDDDGGFMWTTTRVGENKKPKTISEIVAYIEHAFGIHITTGHIRGKGYFEFFTI